MAKKGQKVNLNSNPFRLNDLQINKDKYVKFNLKKIENALYYSVVLFLKQNISFSFVCNLHSLDIIIVIVGGLMV